METTIISGELEFIIYATIYRLSIVGAGSFFVYMGYRLFKVLSLEKGTEERGDDGKTTITTKMDKFELTIKNAAPGTCFAFFGALIISIMIYQGNPEYNKKEEFTGPEGIQVKTETTMKGGEIYHRTLLNQGDTFFAQGNLEGAIEKYGEALSNPSLSLGESADPLFGLASVYFQQKRYQEALAYVRLVYMVEPKESRSLVLMAETEYALGNRKEALGAMDEAAKINPSLKSKLEDMENR